MRIQKWLELNAKQKSIPSPFEGAKQVVKCQRCKCEFEARVADIKRGWGKFCSKSCKATKQEQRTGQMSRHLSQNRCAYAWYKNEDRENLDNYDPSDSEYWDSKDY